MKHSTGLVGNSITIKSSIDISIIMKIFFHNNCRLIYKIVLLFLFFSAQSKL